MKTFSIYPSNLWILDSYLNWIVGSKLGIILLIIFMYWWKFELVLYSSSMEEISNKFFDGFQSNSYGSRICWQSWISLSVVGCMMTPQVDTLISIGTKRSSEYSIPNYLCGSVGSSHICIPNFWHWFEFTGKFSILFPNHKSYPNSSMPTSTESSVNTVTQVHIVILNFLYIIIGMETQCTPPKLIILVGSWL